MTTNQRRTRAAGDGRERRRDGARRAWVRPATRLDRAIRSSIRLIEESGRTAARCERSLHRRPVRTSQQLDRAAARLNVAAARLLNAAAEFHKTSGRTEAQQTAGTPPLLRDISPRCADVFGILERTYVDIADLLESLIDAEDAGLVRPERRSIRLTAPPPPIRTFLEVRQPRVIDRIAPLLRRRRRTRRPAEVRVPRRSLLGRAPPPASISLL